MDEQEEKQVPKKKAKKREWISLPDPAKVGGKKELQDHLKRLHKAIEELRKAVKS